MKRVMFVILLLGLVVLPLLYGQADADREVARTQEFIGATMQKGQAKVDALKAYIKKFPETTSRWTRLAHYHLSIGYFELKDYSQAADFANKTLKLGSLEPGEEGRLLLVIANCYGVKSASIFNQEKALEYAKKAISFAETNKLNDVLGEARKLKGQLSGPVKKEMPPEQKIKMLYSNAEYSEAISLYQSLGAADKANPEIHKTYANALFKANKLDSALKEFQDLYAKDKKAINALRIADIYAEKAKKNKALDDSAVNFYLEASVLYGKEGNSSNQNIAYKKAEFQMFEKYDFNKKVKALEAENRKNKASAEKNESEIRRAEYELRKLKRTIQRDYEMQDIDPPDYLTKKTTDLQKKITALKSGVSTQATDGIQNLEQEKKRIQTELNDLLTQVKKKFQ